MPGEHLAEWGMEACMLGALIKKHFYMDRCITAVTGMSGRRFM